MQQLEETFLNNGERSSEVRNATILMVLAGVLNICFGYQSYLLALAILNSLLMTFGTLMMVFGLLPSCASLTVWLKKSWATKVIAGVGAANCVILIMSGFYLMVILFAPIYWLAIDQLRKVA
jgi:hypothetical protein